MATKNQHLAIDQIPFMAAFGRDVDYHDMVYLGFDDLALL